MRPRFTLVLALAAAAALAGGSAALGAGDPEAAYQALLTQAKASPDTADWQALRFAYAARPSFQVFAESAARRTMLEAADKGDCATALPAARAVIAERFIDADAHMVAAFCEETAGDAAAAGDDRAIGAALIHSIETGDGRSPATAFTVIDVDEEYATLRALGVKLTDQTMIHAGPHAYDALTAVGDQGATATYYFLIDRVLAAEAAALRPGSVSEGGPPDRTP